MGMPDDFAAYLLSSGFVDYELVPDPPVGWGVGTYVMPAAPDQVVIVGEYAGGPTEQLRTAVLGKPGLQIRVRGAAFDSSAASAKITTIALVLDGLDPLRINGTQYLAVLSQQSASFFLGLDAANRPEFSWNFIVWRSH